MQSQVSRSCCPLFSPLQLSPIWLRASHAVASHRRRCAFLRIVPPHGEQVALGSVDGIVGVAGWGDVLWEGHSHVSTEPYRDIPLHFVPLWHRDWQPGASHLRRVAPLLMALLQCEHVPLGSVACWMGSGPGFLSTSPAISSRSGRKGLDGLS